MKKAWEMSTVSILTALKKQPTVDGVLVDDLQYTVLDNHKVVYRDSQELAELHAINPKNSPKYYAAYRPERLALHESIVAVSTQLQLMNEENIQQTAKMIYEEVMITLPSLQLENIRMRIEQDNKKLVEKYLAGEDIRDEENGEKIYAICEEIKNSNAAFGSFIEGYSMSDAMVARSTDILFTESAQQIITTLVATTIASHTELQPLIIPSPAERLTLIVAGGPASGKGSAVAQLIESASAAGVDNWANIAKINTDMYKPLLLTPGTVRPELYSQLAQEEASTIHQNIQNRLTNMAMEGRAPHTFIDQVYAGKDKLEYGLINGGKVRGTIVSTDTEDALIRSYGRGVKDGDKGRYESTHGLLRLHKSMTEQAPTTLSAFSGQDIQFLFVDNNVPEDQPSQKFMTVDMKNQDVVIYSQEKLARFALKTSINIDAKSSADLYHHAGHETAYLAPLEAKGVHITIIETVTSEISNTHDMNTSQGLN